MSAVGRLSAQGQRDERESGSPTSVAQTAARGWMTPSLSERQSSRAS